MFLKKSQNLTFRTNDDGPVRKLKVCTVDLPCLTRDKCTAPLPAFSRKASLLFSLSHVVILFQYWWQEVKSGTYSPRKEFT